MLHRVILYLFLYADSLFFLGSMQWSRLAIENLTARAGHQLLNFTLSLKSEKGNEKMIVFGGGNNDGDFYNDAKEVEFKYKT